MFFYFVEDLVNFTEKYTSIRKYNIIHTNIQIKYLESKYTFSEKIMIVAISKHFFMGIAHLIGTCGVVYTK